MLGHSGHSSFLEKCLQKKILKDNKKNAYRRNNRNFTVSTVSKPPDARLQSQDFREAVRLVFLDLGVQNRMSNFRKYDGIIDWLDYARNLQSPEWPATAECLMRGEPTGKTIGITLRGRTREDARNNMDERNLRFVDWW